MFRSKPLKLKLNRETVQVLNAASLERVVGGRCSRGTDSGMSGCSTYSEAVTFDEINVSRCDPCCPEVVNAKKLPL